MSRGPLVSANTCWHTGFPLDLSYTLNSVPINSGHWQRHVHRRRVRQTSDRLRSVVDNTWQHAVTCAVNRRPTTVTRPSIILSAQLTLQRAWCGSLARSVCVKFLRLYVPDVVGDAVWSRVDVDGELLLTKRLTAGRAAEAVDVVRVTHRLQHLQLTQTICFTVSHAGWLDESVSLCVCLCPRISSWRHVALVVVLWRPALLSTSSASITALRWEPVHVHV